MSERATGTPGALAAAEGAVGYLRRRTVGRAADSYRRWIGRAVGWWTIVYMLFWIVVFAIAGVETLAPLAQPLPFPAGIAAAAAGVLLLSLALLGGRTPPFILDRRDLYRLALAPQRPWSVMRWRYLVKQGGGLVAAVLIGLVWSLVAGPWFGLQVPYAAPALALLALFLLDARWLRYVAHPRHGQHEARSFAGRALGGLWLVAFVPLLWVALRHLLVGGLAALPPALDPLGALEHDGPLVLLLPALLALASHLCVRRTLAHDWPPRFAPQSLVLTQVQALRTSEVLSGLAGLGARVADEGEKRRLLDALHDRPGATRPRRSLPLPGTHSPQWLALAWRTASALYRRPLLRLVGTLVVAALAVASVLAASGLGPSLAGLGTAGLGAEGLDADGLGAAGSGTAPGAALGIPGLGGALAVFFAALFAARVASGLLGPQFEVGARPVDPLTRAWGRALPALLLLTLLTLPVMFALRGVAELIGGGLPPQEALVGNLIGAVSLIGIVVLALEKYASWSGAGASRWEPQLVAAMLAALPALVLAALGVGDWTLMTQALLLGLVAILPV